MNVVLSTAAVHENDRSIGLSLLLSVRANSAIMRPANGFKGRIRTHTMFSTWGSHAFRKALRNHEYRGFVFVGRIIHTREAASDIQHQRSVDAPPAPAAFHADREHTQRKEVAS
jgi:hypothetical protein